MTGTIVLILRVLLALALYGFLCLVLWMIWEDVKRAAYQATRPKVPPLRVEVVSRGTAPVQRAFTQSEVTLGRDPICELHLEDEAISARHAKFSFHHGHWWVEDLHSTNGTTLNQARLMAATVLTDGDEIRCGQATFLVKLHTDQTTPHPAGAEEHND